MSILDVVLIGLALSMDACALTISNCTVYKNSLNKKTEWAMPITFALFQGVMPVIGFYLGSLFSKYLTNIGGYLTAAVFYALTVKIVIDIVKDYKKEKAGVVNDNPQRFTVLLLLIQGLATSIDALIAGITFSINLTFSIFYAVLIIAGITFVMVVLALLLGKFLGKILGKYANYLGAVILFAVATKTLIEAILG